MSVASNGTGEAGGATAPAVPATGLAALWRDPLAVIVLAAYALSSVPYFVPGLSSDFLWTYGDSYADKIQLVGLLAALLIGLRSLERPRERRFWRYLTAGFLLWFGVRLLYVVFPYVAGKAAGDIPADLGYLLFYLCLILASEVRPDRPHPGLIAARLYRFEIAAAVVFVVAVTGYFVIVPSAFIREAYETWIPSQNMYLALDAFLAGRFLYLAATTHARRYRWIYGCLGAAAIMWFGTDLVEGLYYGKLIELPWGTWIDLLWLPPFPLLVIAARLRHAPFPDDTEARPPSPLDEQDWSTLRAAGPTIVLTLVLPIAHFALYGFGILDAQVQDIRALLVFLSLLAFGTILVLQQRRLERTQQTLKDRLHEANERLQQSQKMEAIGRLAGGVAHDFNNLLTAISGHAELLRDGLSEEDRRRRDVEEIERAAERAADLTRQLLAFSRRQVTQRVVLDLNRVVADVETMLARLIGADVHLVTRCSRERCYVKADRGQIEQVLMNLVVNARDAMPEGGTLSIRTSVHHGEADGDDEPFNLGSERHVVLEISDTGAGMDAATRRRIFEPFFTTKEKGKGTGLGLAIVYGIVRQSDGEIWVDSEPGAGTTVRIALPAVDALPEGDERDSSISSFPGVTVPAARTVLLAEDESGVRMLMRGVLQREGHRVLEARNGEEALRVARTEGGKIDLLLTDVVMPKMGGPELARRLAADLPDLKVLYVSGYSDELITGTELEDNPAVSFLQKPFKPRELASRVRKVLEEDTAT